MTSSMWILIMIITSVFGIGFFTGMSVACDFCKK